MKNILLFVSLLTVPMLSACTTPTAAAQTGETTTPANDFPEELGIVRWGRDFEAARTASRETGKPMFVLFDEVPGCNTVKQFGKTVLSDPLIADAIEEAFIPVVIYNNVGGQDRTLLKSFGEPTWNNPVVRIITPDRKPLATRFAGPYDAKSLVKNMRDGLNAVSYTHLTLPTTPYV